MDPFLDSYLGTSLGNRTTMDQEEDKVQCCQGSHFQGMKGPSSMSVSPRYLCLSKVSIVFGTLELGY